VKLFSKRMAALFNITLLMLPAGAAAAPVQGLKYIPKWTIINDHACYVFDDARRLLELDSQLDMLIRQADDWKIMNADLQEGAAQLNLALTHEKLVAETLKKNGDDLAAKLMVETTRANKAEAKAGPAGAVLLGGGIALVVVGLVTGILVGVYAAK